MALFGIYHRIRPEDLEGASSRDPIHGILTTLLTQFLNCTETDGHRALVDYMALKDGLRAARRSK